MDFINSKMVYSGYKAASREDAIKFLAKQGVEMGYATDVDNVYQAFLVRENEGETGLMDGFAIPHAKSDVIKKAGVFFLKLAHPVEWPSLDGKPVDICVALFVPETEAGTTHLKLLSKTAILLMDAERRKKIRTSYDQEEICRVINDGLKD